MINAKNHQQQPANLIHCEICGEEFNNLRRLIRHQMAEIKNRARANMELVAADEDTAGDSHGHG